MKKLLLMLLAVAGMVGTASAEDITIFFKPDASTWGKDGASFKLYLSSDGSTKASEVAMTGVTDHSGIYQASFDNSTYTHFKFVRMSSDGQNLWTEHDTYLSATADAYYVMSGLYDNSYEKLNITDNYHSQWIVSGSHQITPEAYEWGTGSTTYLSTTDNITYTLAINNKPIKAGTYYFKFVGGSSDWVGNGNDNISLTIENDGNYTLTYTFDALNRTGSCVASDYVANSNLSYKYFVYDGEAKPLTGKDWWENEMTVTEGTASFTVNNVNVNAGTYGFKIVEQLYDGETAAYTYWPNYSTSDGYFSAGNLSNRCYDLTFSYAISSSTPGFTASAITTGYYFIINNGSWRVGDHMTESDGTYTGTISNLAGGLFAIIPAGNLSEWENNTWTSVIRPEAYYDDNCPIYFSNYSDWSTSNNSGKVWSVPSGFDGSINFTYNRSTGKWSAAPYFTREIDGYATMSIYDNAEHTTCDGIAIPEGVTAYYATAAEAGSVTMTSISNGIPRNQGAFLKASGTYTFTPATTVESTLTTNYLKPGTASGVTASTEGAYNYVFASQGSELGFFNVATAIDNDMTGKAYLQTTSSIKPASGARVAIVFDDESTGIETVKGEVAALNGCYNLSGQRVAQPTRGLFIVNGKKVLVK